MSFKILDTPAFPSGYTIPTANLPATTAQLIDLTAASCYKAIDTDQTASPILIADTTKPANPQYTHTIASGDFPTSTDFSDWFVIVTIGGKNNDVSTRTMNTTLTINGAEIGSPNSVGVTNAKFWRSVSRYIAAPIAIGDVVGVKMWGSVANQLDYRAVTLYVLPRSLGPGASAKGTAVLRNGVTAIIAGAIAGATYAGQSVGSSIIYDLSASVITATNAVNMAATTGETIMPAAASVDGQVAILGNDATQFLHGITVNRYLRRLVAPV